MNYKDMVGLLPYHIAGCPEFVVEKAIKDAVRSFCKRSGAYRANLDPIDTYAGEYEYDFDLPSKTSVVEILSVTVAQKELEPDTEQGATHANPMWETEQSPPPSYIRASSKTLHLVPVPIKSDDAVSMSVSLKPTLTATSVQTDFVEDYVDGIMAGALANLFNSQDMPWANPQRAMKHEMEFEAHIRDAKSRADGRRGPTRRTVRYGGL